jgi:hypothetical protein
MEKTVKRDKKFDLNVGRYWYPQITLTGNFSTWVGYDRKDIYTDVLIKWTDITHVTNCRYKEQKIMISPRGTPVAHILLHDKVLKLYSAASDYPVVERDMSEGVFSQDDCDILTNAVNLLSMGFERSTEGQRLWYPRDQMVEGETGHWIPKSDLE